MNEFCSCERLTHIKVEADFYTDPLWCSICGYNLDIDEFPLRELIKEKLMLWVEKYEAVLGGNFHQSSFEYELNKREYNQVGLELTEEIKKDIGHQYNISFSYV
ncbi:MULTISPECIES: hypothetical protein [Kurthia]|uniref:hypothetical protein n=1 Tax=Kurthia TaxID=1649 RepID=UPI0034CD1F96